MKTTTTTPVVAPRQATALRRVLGLGDEVGTSISSMAPTFTIGVALGSLAAIVGPPMVIMWAIAILPMLAIAAGFVALKVKDPRAGTVYTWAGRYLHPIAGFLGGWLAVGGFTVFMGYAVQAMGSTSLQVLQTGGLLSADAAAQVGPAAVVGVVWLALLAWLAVRGIDIAAKLQKVVVTIDLVVVLGVCGWALLRGGGEPFSWDWVNRFAIGSFQTFVNGLVAPCYLYWGWDNTLRLNEESRDGGRSAGRAGLYSLLVVVAVFMFCQVGFQHVTTQDELVEQGANGLVLVAQRWRIRRLRRCRGPTPVEGRDRAGVRSDDHATDAGHERRRGPRPGLVQAPPAVRDPGGRDDAPHRGRRCDRRRQRDARKPDADHLRSAHRAGHAGHDVLRHRRVGGRRGIPQRSGHGCGPGPAGRAPGRLGAGTHGARVRHQLAQRRAARLRRHQRPVPGPGRRCSEAPDGTSDPGQCPGQGRQGNRTAPAVTAGAVPRPAVVSRRGDRRR